MNERSEKLSHYHGAPGKRSNVLGGTFQMDSAQEESWRSDDELQHTVAVSDFYMGIHELTQVEYQEIMGENPSGIFPRET